MTDEITQDTPTHSEAFVLKSEGLRMINYQIDQAVEDLNQRLRILQSNFKDAFGEGERGWRFGAAPDINVRTFAEGAQGREDVPLAGDIDRLSDLRDDIDEIVAFQRQIAALGRLKLRLLNDYDFTKGFPRDQIAFFGPAPEETPA